MRIAGNTISDDKHLCIALTGVVGIGRSKAKEILNELNIEETKKAADLSREDETALRTRVEGETIEGELRREVSQNIKRLKDIQSYRGDRHSRRLPVRGQRTKTNVRTLKGNVRKTMGSGRRKVEKT